jgi:hypothetical protein
MDKTDLTVKLGLVALGSYILAHLVYRLALEVWCIAYGILY